MAQRRIKGVYPTGVNFAWRMLMCLTTVGGTLSKAEFNKWFFFRGAKRALRRFKRLAFRVYVQMHLKKSILTRLKGHSYRVRIRLMRRVQRRLCNAWKTPSAYALYREVITKGFDRKAFIIWWNGLSSFECSWIIYTWADQIKESATDMWLDSRSDDARIFVQLSSGDSGTVREF